jgi:hypothetical protein
MSLNLTLYDDSVAGQASILLGVPRDPEVRGFVRMKQQHRDTPKAPYECGATAFVLPQENS